MFLNKKKKPIKVPYKLDKFNHAPPLFKTSQSNVVHIQGDYQSLCGNIRLLNTTSPQRNTFIPTKVKTIRKNQMLCPICLASWNVKCMKE